MTGAGGQLGLELRELLPQKGHKVVALAREELNITDASAVGRTLKEHTPDLVINAAAYTNVDRCETETDLAYQINALGPRNLAVHCERLGCELLHVSTNYVFDGRRERPYEPFDPTNPINAYGRTKLAGEEYVKHLSSHWYIVRSAGIYGKGDNFVRTMLRLGKERDSLTVKNDEFISPTYARDLAEGIAEVIHSRLYGLYHITNSGSCSWYELSREIFKLAEIEVEVIPVISSEYPLPASRPSNGVLSASGGPELRHWREGLEEYLREE